MAMDRVSSALAIRSSVGIELWASAEPRQPYEHKPYLPQEATKNSRSISFSPDGRYFAYSNGQEIRVLATFNWQLHCVIQRPKAFYLKFSPRGNYLCVWELYVVTKDKPEGAPNMFAYELQGGTEVFSIVQKKQTDWEPSWSLDETLFAMIVGGEAHFYDLANGVSGFTKISRKIGGNRGGILSVGPGHCPPYLAMYAPGVKDAPSMCKLYKYPAVEQNQAVACKSFFQADHVEMLWNKRGSGLLLLTSTEVDKSGKSYYGNQAVHFMSTKNDSCCVPLGKKSPIHCVKWSPKATEFVVVYGFMPSRVSLYNLKCDVIFKFEPGPFNCAYFNPFGNLVVLAGFGNLPGNVEIWDVEKREKLANIKCPDTTQFEWNPDGEHFLTATTAPRLRIGNGFKVYHYSGALMHETIWPSGQELLGVEWQQFPEHTFTAPVITKMKHEGIKSSQPEASKNVYTPPHLRLKKEGKNPEDYIPQPQSQHQLYHSVSGGTKSNSYKNNASQKNKFTKLNNLANNGTQQQAQSPHSNDNGVIQQNNGSGININASTHTNNIKKQRELNANFDATALLVVGNVEMVDKQSIGEGLDQKQKRQRQRRPKTAGKVVDNQNPVNIDSSRVIVGNQQIDGGSASVQLEKVASIAISVSYNGAERETEKKIRTVAKKLSDIKKLKQRRDNGEILELNQINKIGNERKFLDELKALKSSQSAHTNAVVDTVVTNLL